MIRVRGRSLFPFLLISTPFIQLTGYISIFLKKRKGEIIEQDMNDAIESNQEVSRYNNRAKNKSLVSFSQQMAYGAVLTLNLVPSLLSSQRILRYVFKDELLLLTQEFTRHFIPSVLMPIMFYIWSPAARKHLADIILRRD